MDLSLHKQIRFQLVLVCFFGLPPVVDNPMAVLNVSYIHH